MKRYMRWLYFNVLGGSDNVYKRYKSLFKTLMDIPYRYTHPMDKNRYMDGLRLREDYMDETGKYFVDICDECTVFEMFVALAYRMEKDIMAPALGDFDSFRWFWGFIETLELDEFDEDHYDEGWIYKIIDAFLDRKYDKNGKNGGIFIVKNVRKPLYHIEIWEQVGDFLNEHYIF